MVCEKFWFWSQKKPEPSDKIFKKFNLTWKTKDKMAVPCSSYRWEIWSALPTKHLLLLWVYRRQHKNIHQDILKKICVKFSFKRGYPFKRLFGIPLKVSKFRNEFMKFLFLPKHEEKIVRISSLCCEGQKSWWWLHKNIQKSTDLL